MDKYIMNEGTVSMENLTPLINSALSKEMQLMLYLLGSWAQKKSMRVYAVGGFVRDLLLGKENNKIDLLVNNSAVEFAKSLKVILPGKFSYYERFGTATLKLPKNVIFDMVTARNELYSLPGTLSVSEHLKIKNDLFRRDFTINTLACTLNPDNFGLLHDYFGGVNDLKKGMIKALYKLSFVDDPLRILRALSLEQRFDFQIEEETFSLLHSAITKRLLEKVSKERLYQEVKLIFLEPSPSRVLERMHELGLFGVVFPRVPFNLLLKNSVEQLELFLRKWEVKGWGKKPDPVILFLSLLLYGLSEHDLKYLCYVMRLKKKEWLTIITILDKLPVLLRHLRQGNLRSSEANFFLKTMPPEGLALIFVLEKEQRIRKRILSFWERQRSQKPFLNEKGEG
ncbi:MAG: CCA tRNA nucleotidyltransferase [Dethiobacteria bacterium]